MSDEEQNGLKVSEGGDQTLMVFVFFLFLIMFNFLIIHSFADKCSTDDVVCSENLNQWYVFVFRFQTLIGGALAVVAAYATVRQMRLSDKEAEERNRKVLIAMDREYYEGCATLQRFWESDLAYRNSVMPQQLKILRDFVSEDDKFWEALGAYNKFYEGLKMIESSFENPIWVDNKKSLSAEGRQLRDLIIRSCDYNIGRIERWNNLLAIGKSDQVINEFDPSEAYFLMEDFLEDFSRLGKTINEKALLVE